MMKFEHVRPEPFRGPNQYFAILSGSSVPKLDGLPILRCGAYRFAVHAVVQNYPEAATPTAAVVLSSPDSPQVGMLAHLLDEPLTAEELTTAVQHLLMLPHLLKGIDSVNVYARLRLALLNLEADADRQLHGTASALARLAYAAYQFNEHLPSNVVVREVERYKSEILGACLSNSPPTRGG